MAHSFKIYIISWICGYQNALKDERAPSTDSANPPRTPREQFPLLTIPNLHNPPQFMTMPPTSVSTICFLTMPFLSKLSTTRTKVSTFSLPCNSAQLLSWNLSWLPHSKSYQQFSGLILRNLFSTVFCNVDYSFLPQTLWPWLSEILYPSLPPSFALFHCSLLLCLPC